MYGKNAEHTMLNYSSRTKFEKVYLPEVIEIYNRVGEKDGLNVAPGNIIEHVEDILRNAPHT